MNPTTRTRILIVALFIFPVAVMVFFWFFGKSPADPAATLPVMPPR
jgi:hypothetical protein